MKQHVLPYFVGLDVGGTTMKAGVVDDAGLAVRRTDARGLPLCPVSLATEAHLGQGAGLARMCEAIGQAVEVAAIPWEQIAGIGVATPGTMDLQAGVILDPPNLRPWQNVPVRSYIEQVFKLPTAFQNDANAAALGEYWVGAGRGARSMVLFTLGTGVGGGIVLGDRIIEGEHSHGAELGHIRIEITEPRRCGCGRAGCLEAYASATAVVRRTLEALERDGGQSSLHRIVRSGEALTAKAIFQTAQAGDLLAAKIVEETAFYLAVGATNMMHTIDPDVVVFGGGMVAAGEAFLDRIRHHVAELAFPVPAARTLIRYAELGSDAGFIGAAACGRQAYLRTSAGRG